jgi:hypothetical protein
VYLDASQRNLPSSRTEEHVFAKWYRNEVVNNKIKMFTATLGSSPTLHRQPPLERLVNTGVCRECNEGWMSRLETGMAPIVQRILAGEDIDGFSYDEIELIARWAGKTTAVVSHVTPQLARVPRFASMSLHPKSDVRPRMRFFYSKISADLTLEGGFLQLVYGSELGLVGTAELPGARITLCIYNHCLTVDFPPIVEGVSYDLSESCSAMLWPTRIPAGVAELNVPTPALISDVLYAICSRIKVNYTTNTFRS